MGDIEKLEARLDAALVRAKAARADGQRAENEALDLMIQIGTHSARKAEVERDAAVARAEAAEARAALAEADARLALAVYYTVDRNGITRYGFGGGVPSEAEIEQLDVLREAYFYTPQEDTAIVLRRILATARGA